jgi:hypothetical protein
MAIVTYSILYPPILNTEKLFLKIGYANLVLEFQWLRKSLPFIILLSIIIVGVFIVVVIAENTNLDEIPAFGSDVFLWEYFANVVTFVAIGVIIRIISMIVRRDFRFHFVKGCCKIISEREDDLGKIKYLRLSLIYYDKYLKRRIKLGIDENKIYSAILNKSYEERSQIMNQMRKSVEGHRLDLANYLSSIHKTPDSEFYVVETAFQKLKAIGAALATAIPIIISIMGLIVVKH